MGQEVEECITYQPLVAAWLQLIPSRALLQVVLRALTPFQCPIMA